MSSALNKKREIMCRETNHRRAEGELTCGMCEGRMCLQLLGLARRVSLLYSLCVLFNSLSWVPLCFFQLPFLFPPPCVSPFTWVTCFPQLVTQWTRGWHLTPQEEWAHSLSYWKFPTKTSKCLCFYLCLCTVQYFRNPILPEGDTVNESSP